MRGRGWWLTVEGVKCQEGSSWRPVNAVKRTPTNVVTDFNHHCTATTTTTTNRVAEISGINVFQSFSLRFYVKKPKMYWNFFERCLLTCGDPPQDFKKNILSINISILTIKNNYLFLKKTVQYSLEFKCSQRFKEMFFKWYGWNIDIDSCLL